MITSSHSTGRNPAAGFARTAAVAAALLSAVAGSGSLVAADPEVLVLEGDVAGAHDPAAIREGDTCYVFTTGGRPGRGILPIRSSKDLRRWTLAGQVFARLPE